MLKNRLKYWRHQKQMEKKEFSEWLGVGQSQYSRWENQVVQPTLESAWKIAKKLQISIEQLFEEVE
jgi:putative transcriptional regulator